METIPESPVSADQIRTLGSLFQSFSSSVAASGRSVGASFSVSGKSEKEEPQGDFPPLPTVATATSGTRVVVIPPNFKASRGEIWINNALTGEKLYKVLIPQNKRPGSTLSVRPPIDDMYSVMIPHGAKPNRKLAFRLSDGRVGQVTVTPEMKPGAQTVVKMPRVAELKGMKQMVKVSRIPDTPLKGNNVFCEVNGMMVLVHEELFKEAKQARVRIPACLPSMPKLQPDRQPSSTRWRQIYHVNEENFHWVRFEGGNPVLSGQHFDPSRSSFVPVLDRASKFFHVPGHSATVEYAIVNGDDKVANHEDVLQVQYKNIRAKHEFLKNLSVRLLMADGVHTITIPEGNTDIFFLESINAIKVLTSRQLKWSWWKVQSKDENGKVKDLPTQAWFQRLIKLLLGDRFGIWKKDANGHFEPVTGEKSILSESTFRTCLMAMGRILGKALLQGCPIPGVDFTASLYNHLCAHPLDEEDLKELDPKMHSTFMHFHGLKPKQLAKMLKNTPSYFSLPQTSSSGETQQIPLVPGGAQKRVTMENFPDFMEACFKHTLLNRFRPHIDVLTDGFLDVMPDPSITRIFSPIELRIVMRGFPKLSVEEWRKATTYSGTFELLGLEHPHVQWFWEVVEEMDYMTKVRFVQFVSSASVREVFLMGFKVLAHRNIVGLPGDSTTIPCVRPTGSNMLEIPPFATPEDMKQNILRCLGSYFRLDVE